MQEYKIILQRSNIIDIKYRFKLTLATKIVDPSLPACKLLITSGGMFGLLRIEGGKFTIPGATSGPCPPGNCPPTRCNALRACSPSGSCNTGKNKANLLIYERTGNKKSYLKFYINPLSTNMLVHVRGIKNWISMET